MFVVIWFYRVDSHLNRVVSAQMIVVALATIDSELFVTFPSMVR